MVGMGSRGTEACDSSLRVVLVVWVPGFLCSVLAWLCFLCSVLAWLWCCCAPVGYGSRELAGVLAQASPVVWSRSGDSSAPGPRESPASRVRRPRGCGFA